MDGREYDFVSVAVHENDTITMAEKSQMVNVLRLQLCGVAIARDCTMRSTVNKCVSSFCQGPKGYTDKE